MLKHYKGHTYKNNLDGYHDGVILNAMGEVIGQYRLEFDSELGLVDSLKLFIHHFRNMVIRYLQ